MISVFQIENTKLALAYFGAEVDQGPIKHICSAVIGTGASNWTGTGCKHWHCVSVINIPHRLIHNESAGISLYRCEDI